MCTEKYVFLCLDHCETDKNVVKFTKNLVLKFHFLLLTFLGPGSHPLGEVAIFREMRRGLVLHQVDLIAYKDVKTELFSQPVTDLWKPVIYR